MWWPSVRTTSLRHSYVTESGGASGGHFGELRRIGWLEGLEDEREFLNVMYGRVGMIISIVAVVTHSLSSAARVDLMQ